MAAATYDFTIEQGATFETTFVWRDDNGDAVNLTGYTARMQVRTAVSDSAVLEGLTTDNDKIDLNPNGEITLALSAAQTAAITWNEGVYDLELVSANGRVTRLLKGKITVDPEVTRL